MKNFMNRILAAAALLACFACAKTETDIEKATSMNEKGKVYGYIEPLTTNTRAYWSNTDLLPFQIELNDKVNVWTPKGTHMEYMVSEILEAGHFALDTEEFELILEERIHKHADFGAIGLQSFHSDGIAYHLAFKD